MMLAQICQICSKPSLDLVSCALCGRIVCQKCCGSQKSICNQCDSSGMLL